MPLARIDLVKGKSAEYRRVVGDVIYHAVIGVLKAPKDDRFQIFTEHEPDGLIANENYLGIKRSKDCIILQVFMNQGRTLEQKKDFYKAVCDGLHQRLDLRREDIFISLVEVPKENWSFGNGEAQYAS